METKDSSQDVLEAVAKCLECPVCLVLCKPSKEVSRQPSRLNIYLVFRCLRSGSVLKVMRLTRGGRLGTMEAAEEVGSNLYDTFYSSIMEI